MRWIVFLRKHPDDDSQKPTNLWNTLYLKSQKYKKDLMRLKPILAHTHSDFQRHRHRDGAGHEKGHFLFQ